MKKLFCAASLLLLAACGDTTVKQTLGLDRASPDEFRVVSRPPLSVPPQFDLRPPGAEGTTPPATRDKAQSLVLGNEADTKAPATKSSLIKGQSAAENQFLQKAGAAEADPNVKKELADKKIEDQLQKEDQNWWDRMTTIPPNKEPVVKAPDEADRIKKNQEEGKPVTEGATPETGGGPVSTLRHWFGDW